MSVCACAICCGADWVSTTEDCEREAFSLYVLCALCDILASPTSHQRSFPALSLASIFAKSLAVYTQHISAASALCPRTRLSERRTLCGAKPISQSAMYIGSPKVRSSSLSFAVNGSHRERSFTSARAAGVMGVVAIESLGEGCAELH